MNDSQIVQVGLASFGMSGKVFHAPFIERNPNFNLKLILERSKSNSKELYPNARIVRSFEELISDNEIELIVINTPTYLHYEMAKQALLAGKHIVLEKPMTATSQQSEELINIAKEQNLLIAVYHNKRLEGGFKTVKKLLSENKLGALKNCHISMHRYKPEIGVKLWKEGDYSGAGLLYDIGSHLIDQCLDLFGWPINVEADLQIQRKDSQVIDYFYITLKYKNFNAVIVSDMLTQENKPSFHVIGSKASYIKYGKDTQEGSLVEGNVNWEKLGEDLEENYGILTLNENGNTEKIKTENGSYIEFYQNVFEALRHDATLLITPKQAQDVIKMIEWIQESSNTK
ncbi:MAG: Gfo/Idh/MocA family oxidoreductase [Cyclobacteriaceae bacterium]|nr:Gfo/Idh/MocA family oxidoreductase [Cyclobacteriaceae bacterium]